ncbi:phage neck terminator protein [Levilactobacillus senmaizukei]|nr:hypothetical protein [Levilactobacillus senmaizukei]
MGIYRDTVNKIISEIHKFQPGWIITKKFQPDDRPPLPFFYYKIVDDYQRLTFNDVENEPFSFVLQLTAVTDDELDSPDLSHDMRKLLESIGLLTDLAESGISLQVESLPIRDLNFGVSNETEAVLSVTVTVNDSYDDTTQSGTITDVILGVTDSKEENNEHS